MPRHANTVPICCVMSRRTFAVLGLGAIASFVTLQACDTRNNGDPGTYAPPTADAEGTEDEAAEPALEDAANTAVDSRRASEIGTLEEGALVDRGFVVDNVLHNTAEGDIHFSLHVPVSYDGTRPFALYVHCPGWEGLWFQGVGAHLVEDFVFVANDYAAEMIVATPQLDDWGETSAHKAILLTEWLMAAYAVDPARVYLSGYSGGGETVSLVMGMQPKLFRRALHMSSQWDGDKGTLVDAQVPVRLSIGEADDYYGSGPAVQAAADIRVRYEAAGLSSERIEELLVLDVKPASYFTDQGFVDQHAGGAALFARDAEIMGWLFGK